MRVERKTNDKNYIHFFLVKRLSKYFFSEKVYQSKDFAWHVLLATQHGLKREKKINFRIALGFYQSACFFFIAWPVNYGMTIFYYANENEFGKFLRVRLGFFPVKHSKRMVSSGLKVNIAPKLKILLVLGMAD